MFEIKETKNLNYSSNNTDEQKLIELAKQGARKALSELVKRYESTVYNFAYKICRDKEKSENIMQETFLSMVKSIHQFDNRSKLSTWLYRIVANHCLMEARKEKRYNYVNVEAEDGSFDDSYFPDVSKLPSKDIENSELREILDNAINKLEPQYRIVFTLRDIEQLSTEETAKIANLSIPAVKSRLHRARAFLRKEITKALKK